MGHGRTRVRAPGERLPVSPDRLRAAEKVVAKQGQAFVDRFGQVKSHPAMSIIRDENTFPDWPLEYQTALFEVDPQKLPERVKAAEAAIFLRQEALASNSDGHAEREAIRRRHACATAYPDREAELSRLEKVDARRPSGIIVSTTSCEYA